MTALTLYLFTHRHGLAARMGHDLRLSTRAARASLASGQVEVRVPLASLEVDGAMRRGQLDVSALNGADRQSILRLMREEVLEVPRHPEAVFRGTARVDGERVDVQGTLTLKGRDAPLGVVLQRRGQLLTGDTSLQPSRWGIRPYSAMGGVLKVTDELELRVELELAPDTAWPPATLS